MDLIPENRNYGEGFLSPMPDEKDENDLSP